MTDYSRLVNDWTYWAELAHFQGVSSSTSCEDCAVSFSSLDYSVHLRNEGTWWIIDTVDDRGQRNADAAKFSSYELAEKYLAWTWASLARSAIGAQPLGPGLYSQGIAPEIDTVEFKTGIYELRKGDERAVLVEPYATIFSHLLSKPLIEIEQMVRQGLE
jgi:hypothetical protein